MSEPPSARARGSLVKVDPAGGASTSIPFQYNPASLKRSLQPAVLGGQSGGHSEAIRFSGAPTEVLSLNVELEALDDLPNRAQNAAAFSLGVFPLLYALETLVYPPAAQVEQSIQMLGQGSLEIAPILTPPVLLVLGPNRIAPVVIQALEVLEQAFDTQLNPLRAVVTLQLRVVSYSDITSTSSVYSQYMAYQKGKELLAAKSQGS